MLARFRVRDFRGVDELAPRVVVLQDHGLTALDVDNGKASASTVGLCTARRGKLCFGRVGLHMFDTFDLLSDREGTFDTCATHSEVLELARLHVLEGVHMAIHIHSNLVFLEQRNKVLNHPISPPFGGVDWVVAKDDLPRRFAIF